MEADAKHDLLEEDHLATMPTTFNIAIKGGHQSLLKGEICESQVSERVLPWCLASNATCCGRSGGEPGERLALQCHPLLLAIIIHDLVALVVRVESRHLALLTHPSTRSTVRLAFAGYADSSLCWGVPSTSHHRILFCLHK